MEKVLTAWGYSNFINIFDDNHINDLSALSALLNDPKEAKEVIPSAGIRLDFKNKLQKHLELNAAVVVENQAEVSIEELKSVNLEKEDPLALSVDENVEEFDQIEVREVLAPSTKKLKLYNAVDELDLKNLLLEHPLGVAIFQRYEALHELCSLSQSLLCEIITLHFLKYEKRPLEDDEFIILRDKITELFSNECPQLYYVPPVPKKLSRLKKPEKAKGKLIDKYRNRKTFIRESNILMKGVITKEEEQKIDDEDDAETSRQWLMLHREPAGVLRHWERTYPLRETDAYNLNYKLADDIYQKWPILKESTSYTLIEKDFLKKCFVTFEEFESTWKKACERMLLLFNDKLSHDEQLLNKSLFCSITSGERIDITKKNYNAFVQLTLLSTILAPKSPKISYDDPEAVGKNNSSKPKKKTWKPTKAEALEGVLIHVKLSGDIENAVSEKRKKMMGFGLSLQPFVIAVGNDLKHLTKAYVRVDQVMYEVPSLLEAVDILFKLYVAFNLNYAPEAENICYFIQWIMYSYHTPFDTDIPKVCSIVKKYQNAGIKV